MPLVKRAKVLKKFILNFSFSQLAFYSILLFAFLVRVIGINYNSAFNDEAIYIVIGRLGLFANDWWSYGANLWMAGVPYIYPSLAALSYETGGLLGSRFLNIIFGVLLVEEVYRFVKLLNLYDKKINELAALISMFLVAFAGIGIFVSKLATYDILSFFLLILGINFFLKAIHHINGKYYFLAFFSLFVAYLTKIVIAIFLPVLFVLSILLVKGLKKTDKIRALKYLYIPFFLATIIYMFFYKDNLATYIATHKDLGKTDSYFNILKLIWDEASILILFAIPNLFLLFITKRLKPALVLITLAVAVPIFHSALLRYATLDKHVYLIIIFLAPIVGYGVAFAYYSKDKLITLAAKLAIPAMFIFTIISARDIVYLREHDWQNSDLLAREIINRTKFGDKILTEEGGAVVLALYDKIFPPGSITTFDWIDYSGLSGAKGYSQAVSDEYFKFIQLDTTDEESETEKIIREKMVNNYKIVYQQGNYQIYERK